MTNYIFNGQTIEQHLMLLAKRGNQAFTSGLHPGVPDVLGIRMPDLRRLARSIAREDVQHYLMAKHEFRFMEERMLYGLVLGYMKPDTSISVYLNRISDFVRLINSWSVCDCFSFAGGKAYFDAHYQEFFDFVLAQMNAEAEYVVRFGVVMSMKYFISADNIELLFDRYSAVDTRPYYVMMAVAWAVAECFVCYPEQTWEFLRRRCLDQTTYNKALQKICESNRVDTGTKSEIRKLRMS